MYWVNCFPKLEILCCIQQVQFMVCPRYTQFLMNLGLLVWYISVAYIFSSCSTRIQLSRSKISLCSSRQRNIIIRSSVSYKKLSFHSNTFEHSNLFSCENWNAIKGNAQISLFIWRQVRAKLQPAAQRF